MKKFLKNVITMSLFVALISAVIPLSACSDGVADEDDRLFENRVKYSEFGAVGDGKTDDFQAVKKAHEYANEHRVAVKADEGKRYYIAPVEDEIAVGTNVDWTGAEFIIDDKSAAEDGRVSRYPVFRVVPDAERQTLTVPAGTSLSAGQTNIGMRFEEPVLLVIYDENKQDFKRRGYGGAGYPRQEIIRVDEQGNVDPSTPIQWDYGTVTKAVACSVTESPLLLRGGTFRTVANDDSTYRNYFERGIKVERSNTRVKNVKHYVEGEGATGSPYNGFFSANYSANVVFENCVMTGHRIFTNSSGATMGTYDTRLGHCDNVRYLGCTQSNDHTDPTFWGVMCSDFCKNLTMDGCTLSRFDAHMGVYNATIVNSDIGQHISVTGGGLLRIENVTRRVAKSSVFFNRFVTLREDYGSFFYGDVVIKDSLMITEKGINYVIAASWYDWDFGYECRFPKSITLDNVRYRYENVDTYKHNCLYIFSKLTDETYETAAASGNPPVLTEKVVIKNNFDPTTGKAKTVFKMIPKEGETWFRNTVVVNE